MKNIIILIAILFNVMLVEAQTLNGTYKNGSDSLFFSNEHITFRISGFGGLSSALVGEGSYEIVDTYILVHTDEYSGMKSNFEELEGSKKDTCVVKVVADNNYPVQGILIESKNKSGKTINAGVTGNDGTVYLTDNEKSINIVASAMGYNSIAFDYKAGSDYRIRLADNDVIEETTAVLRYNVIDEETISIILLTDNFNIEKKREEELKKLEKRARKSNRLDKRYKKEFEPFDDIY
ncbi:MAG: hypothetical protein ITF98_03250 [Fermentimonas sp.]|nr:hypothetical protein [Fermentimonas sp.]